jgi:hypothetical protein
MCFTTSTMAASTKLNNIYVLRAVLSCLLLFWHLLKKETACLLKYYDYLCSVFRMIKEKGRCSGNPCKFGTGEWEAMRKILCQIRKSSWGMKAVINRTLVLQGFICIRIRFVHREVRGHISVEPRIHFWELFEI